MEPLFSVYEFPECFDVSTFHNIKDLACRYLVINGVTIEAFESLASAFQRYPGSTFKAESLTVVVFSEMKGIPSRLDLRSLYRKILGTLEGSKDFYLISRPSLERLIYRRNGELGMSRELMDFLYLSPPAPQVPPVSPVPQPLKKPKCLIM